MSPRMGCVDQRARVTSFECEASVEFTFPRMGTPQFWKSRVWCDGISLREDRVLQEPNGSRRVIRCLSPDKLIFWEEDSVPEQIGIAVHEWVDNELAKEREAGSFNIPPDYRVLGFSTLHSSIYRFHEDISELSLVHPRVCYNLRVATKPVNGVDIRCLYYETPSGAKVEICVDPTFGENPIRIDTWSRDGERHESMQAVYAFSDAAGTWLPKKVTVEAKHKDDLIYREGIEIRWQRVNEPVDRSVFTLSGMNIPEKMIATFPPTPDPMFWDGKERVVGVRGGVDEAEETPPIRSSKFQSWLLWLNVTALFVIGVWLIARRGNRSSADIGSAR